MSIVRDIVKQFDGSEELAQTQRAVVEALGNLGEAKADLYDKAIRESLRTAGTEANPTVPITNILTSKKEVHAYTSTSASHLSETVQTSLKAFMQGSADGVISGIGSLMTGALTVFLGEASSATGTIDEYYVATEGLSVLRLDLKAWYLNVSAKSVYEKMERVCAFVAVKSTVDLAKLDFNTFLYLYQNQLSLGNVRKEQIRAALDDATEIWAAFNKVRRNDVTVEPAHITRHPATTAALPA